MDLDIDLDLMTEYSIEANFSETLRNLKKEKQEDYKIAKEFISSSLDSLLSKQHLTLKLFDMSGLSSISEVENRFLKSGYYPSRILELLSLIDKHPELRKIPIVAFGSGRSFNNGGDFYRPALFKNDNGTNLGRGCFGYTKNIPCCLPEKVKEFLFLGTKKE